MNEHIVELIHTGYFIRYSFFWLKTYGATVDPHGYRVGLGQQLVTGKPLPNLSSSLIKLEFEILFKKIELFTMRIIGLKICFCKVLNDRNHPYNF